MQRTKFEFSVGGIVVSKNKGKPSYLLLKDKNKGNWEFPKGRQGFNSDGDTESLKDTVIREIIEETGISKAHLKILKRMEQLDYQDKDFHQRVYLYLVEAKTKQVKPKHPYDYAWLHFQQIKEKMSKENTLRPFKEAEKYFSR